MVDNLIVKNEQLSAHLHDHIEANNFILLKPKYETFKHLVDTIRLEEKEVSKIYNILKNWHVHYIEVYQSTTYKVERKPHRIIQCPKNLDTLTTSTIDRTTNQYGENPHRSATGRRKPLTNEYILS